MFSTGRALAGTIIVAVAASTYLACSLISLDDLRNDAAADVASDVPLEASGDGGDGGEAGPSLFHCSETSGSRVEIAPNLHADFVRVEPFLGGVGRVIAADYVPDDAGVTSTLVMRGYVLTNNGNMVTPVPLATSSGAQALAARRYSVGGHSGFVVVYQTGYSGLWVTRFPDEQATWTTPILIANIAGDAGLISDVEADVDVLDPTTNDYFVAYSKLTGNTQTICGGEVKGMATTLPVLATFTNTIARTEFDLSSPALAYRNLVGYVLLKPTGNNGPAAPGTPALLVTTGGGKVTITPPSQLNILPIGFADSVDQALVNIALLMVDLTKLTGSISVGQLAVSSLNAIDPQSLPVTTPTAADGGMAGPGDFVFFNPSTHWDEIGGEQLMVIAPSVDPFTHANLGGLNVAWWTATGNVQAYATESAAVFGDVHAWSADAVLSSYVGSVAAVDFAWAELQAADGGGSSSAPPPSDLWIATTSCVKTP